MENPEEILHSLEEFSKMKPKDIPKELDEYLCFVAKTGDPVYQWSSIKSLVREKFINVITEFYEACPSIEIPPCPNVDVFNYDLMKNFILEKLDGFSSAPFTVQRICELLTTPRKEYNRIDKFMRALEKNILVVSTTEPGNRRSTENGESIMNGIESEHVPEPGNEVNVEEMDEFPSWQQNVTQNTEQAENKNDTTNTSTTQEDTVQNEEEVSTNITFRAFSISKIAQMMNANMNSDYNVNRHSATTVVTEKELDSIEPVTRAEEFQLELPALQIGDCISSLENVLKDCTDQNATDTTSQQETEKKPDQGDTESLQTPVEQLPEEVKEIKETDSEKDPQLETSDETEVCNVETLSPESRPSSPENVEIDSTTGCENSEVQTDKKSIEIETSEEINEEEENKVDSTDVEKESENNIETVQDDAMDTNQNVSEVDEKSEEISKENVSAEIQSSEVSCVEPTPQVETIEQNLPKESPLEEVEDTPSTSSETEHQQQAHTMDNVNVNDVHVDKTDVTDCGAANNSKENVDDEKTETGLLEPKETPMDVDDVNKPDDEVRMDESVSSCPTDTPATTTL